MTSLEKAERVFNIFGVSFTVWIAWTNTSSDETKHKIAGFILFAIAACWVVIMIWGVFFRKQKTIPPADSTPPVTPRYIYIGPSGMPVSFVDGKLRVDLRFFSCKNVRLLHVKVYVGSSPSVFTLVDPEPDEITAGEMFAKAVDGPAPGLHDLLLIKPDTPLRVQGTEKFSDNIVQTFDFQTMPRI